MAQSLLLATGGLVLLAAGVALRARLGDISSTLLCAGGIVLVAIAAVSAGSGWGTRIAVVGLYSGAGGCFGEAMAAFLGGSRGTPLPRYIKALLILAAVCIVVQLVESPRPVPVLPMLGQVLFVGALGLRAAVTPRQI